MPGGEGWRIKLVGIMELSADFSRADEEARRVNKKGEEFEGRGQQYMAVSWLSNSWRRE